jgi:hypothetical protein
MTISDIDVEQANARMRRLQQTGSVESVAYRRATKRVVIELITGIQLSIPVDRIEGLAEADAGALAEMDISPSRLGIHWPQLDVDLYIPGVLQGHLGSRKWMATQLGKAGGASTSEAKRAAARENGRLGGRPPGPAAVKPRGATRSGQAVARRRGRSPAQA